MWKWYRTSQGYCTFCALAVIAAFLYMAFSLEPKIIRQYGQRDRAIHFTDQNVNQRSIKNLPEVFQKSMPDDPVAIYTLWLAGATCVLAVVAAIQAGLFVWQLILMNRGTNDAKGAADAAAAAAAAAEQSIVLSRQEFIAVHRPKIILKRSYYRFSSSG
jgi:hypothetical protein